MHGNLSGFLLCYGLLSVGKWSGHVVCVFCETLSYH